jgi:hypothetical protein
VGVDLYWLPLGAGGHFVRLDGRVFEAVVSRLERRPACDLYHFALDVRVPEGRYVIEQTPVPDGDGGGVASPPPARLARVGLGAFESSATSSNHDRGSDKPSGPPGRPTD